MYSLRLLITPPGWNGWKRPLEPMRGSEDFGWYLRQAEGAMFLLGDGEDHPPLHRTDFDFPDALLGTACALFQKLI